MFAALVWHFWIAVVLIVPCVLALVALVVGYLKTVVNPKYPGVDQERG